VESFMIPPVVLQGASLKWNYVSLDTMMGG